MLELPDPCLLRVLKCCAYTRDVLSAGLVHTRLQQLSVLALGSSLTSIHKRISSEEQVDSLLSYLGRYGQHNSSIDLFADDTDGDAVVLQQLPDTLAQLECLCLRGCFDLQLQPGLDSLGVIRAPAGMPLRQLRLCSCTLLDGPAGLAAALSQLPGLEHLDIRGAKGSDEDVLCFPTQALPQLQQLTSLTLRGVVMSAGGGAMATALQPLQSLTRLLSLEIGAAEGYHHQCDVTASMLAGAFQLTHLEVFAQRFDADVLAGKCQLQHLTLLACVISPTALRPVATAQLLSQLQHLRQLTHLNLSSSCQWYEDYPGTPPTARAYAALTASTQLQYLNFDNNTLPPGAWQHMFPDGRQLPNLQVIHIDCVTGTGACAWRDRTELSRLDSSCPNLDRCSSR